MINTNIDPRLDARIYFDSRSRAFPITEILPTQALDVPKSASWYCPRVLDQGQQGSCVGHGWAHELIALPAPIQNVTHDTALKIYKLAQTMDEWPGEDYEGTSTLAGVKAVMQLYPHAYDSYRWAFGLDDVVATLGYFGPVVLGIPWYTSMYTPDINGVVRVTGGIAGRHCILATGVDVVRRRITLQNSWGLGWGKKGKCIVPYNEMAGLLSEQGEACVAVGRHNFNV